MRISCLIASALCDGSPDDVAIQEYFLSGTYPTRRQVKSVYDSLCAYVNHSDDTPANVKLLVDLLTVKGYVASSAVNGEQALAMIAANAVFSLYFSGLMAWLQGFASLDDNRTRFSTELGGAHAPAAALLTLPPGALPWAGPKSEYFWRPHVPSATWPT